MKNLKSFEQHANESHASPLSAAEQVEILNRYLRVRIKEGQYEDTPKGLIIKKMCEFSHDKIDFESLSELNLNLYQVEGNFSINRTVVSPKQLKDLKGFPKIVKLLEVSSNPKLASLEGCPSVISEKMLCSFNNKLTSLKGICQDIKMLSLNRCLSLTSLEGIGKVSRLFLLGTPVTDLSPLEGSNSVEVIIADQNEKKNFKNVPKNVTILTSEELEFGV